MFNKATGVAFGFACIQGVVQALDAPCYGYGNILGSASKYLEDDLAQVKELKVGQGEVYVANINYLFEGTNHLRMGYKKVDDDSFVDGGYGHGSKNQDNSKRYNFRNSESRMLNPGGIINKTKESMIAFTFVEWYKGVQEDTADPWVLAAFQPSNVPFYEYIDTVD